MEIAGGYVGSQEIITRKIKALKIDNKKLVELHQTDPSDWYDLDNSSYIYPFDDVNLPDPELIKIAEFCKALPNFNTLTFVFAIVSQKYNSLRCPCSKVMKGWASINWLERFPICLKVSKYTSYSILQHVSDMGRYYVYAYAIKEYLQQLYCDDEQSLRKCVYPITTYIGRAEM